MFGITTLATSAAALALIAALVVPRGDSGQPVIPAAGGGATHVVAADGSGSFTTIGEAVAAAAEGDTILVKPGQYREALVIDKDITLQGDGPREGIVFSFPEGGPNDPDWGLPVTLVVKDSRATIAGLTILTPAKGGAVWVSGGSPTFEDVSVENVPDGMGTFNFGEGTSAIVRDSSWDGFWMIDASPVTIEGNTINGFSRLFGPDPATISGNTFLAGADLHVQGLAGLIEGNEFTDAAITVESGADSDSAVTVRGNTFHDVRWNADHGQAAILVQDAGSTTDIVDNTITGSDTGIGVAFGSAATIMGNDLSGNRAALVVTSSDVAIEGNTITANETGLRLGKTVEMGDAGLQAGDAARPTVTGNYVLRQRDRSRGPGRRPEPHHAGRQRGLRGRACRLSRRRRDVPPLPGSTHGRPGQSTVPPRSARGVPPYSRRAGHTVEPATGSCRPRFRTTGG